MKETSVINYRIQVDENKFAVIDKIKTISEFVYKNNIIIIIYKYEDTNIYYGEKKIIITNNVCIR